MFLTVPVQLHTQREGMFKCDETFQTNYAGLMHLHRNDASAVRGGGGLIFKPLTVQQDDLYCYLQITFGNSDASI